MIKKASLKKPLILLLCLLTVSVAYPQFNYYPTCRNEIVEHEHYSLCYSEQYEQALWVAYELTGEEVTNDRYERTNDFRRDHSIESGSASLSDYRGSGYDRGHLAPARDMAFSAEAMSESFYLSNMSPQEPGFNRGIWRVLEANVRNWAVENKSIYVASGGIFSSSTVYIGNNRVAIPCHYYKIVLDYRQPEYEAIAFILPNQKGQHELSYYVTTIDEVEAKTGIDFFPALDNDLENRLEGSYELSEWDFSSGSHYASSSSSQQYHTDTDNKINVNTASQAELDQLYGIGPAKAKAIISARPYNSVDELTNAYGIGEATLAKIKPYITVGESHNYQSIQRSKASSGININTASQSQLKSLPGIGEVLSRRIIKARPFTAKSQLLDVKGIGPKRYQGIKDRVWY